MRVEVGPRWRLRMVKLLALVAFGIVAACGSSGDDTLPPITTDPDTASSNESIGSDDPDETTTSATPTSTTTEAPEPTDASGKPILEIPTEWDSDLDEIFGRYQLYWEAFNIAAGLPGPDVNYAPLRELVSEEGFQDLVEDFERYRSDGAILFLADDSIEQHVVTLPNPSVLTKTEGNEVVIQDCYVSDLSFETDQGEVIYEAFESVLQNVKMKVIGGQWRVAAVRGAEAVSEGYDECAGLIDELSQSGS